MSFSEAVSSGSNASEIVKKEVPDWDDEVAANARFKAFSGQRSDWEPRFIFWRDLILNVARQLDVCVVRMSELKNAWFSWRGLTPLCMDQVLHEMHVNGDILLKGDISDPTCGHLYRLFRRAGQVVGAFKSFSFQNNSDVTLIIRKLLQERAAYVVDNLSANNWTSNCVITMKKFQSMCKGSDEASAILSYLCGSRKAQYFAVRKDELIGGVKLSLESKSVNAVTNLDQDILRLIFTSEELQQQLDKINQHWTISRQMALFSYKSGNKQAARRHILQATLFAENLAKCTSFLERVEEVLAAIVDAESTKKVSEALQIGARAVRDFNISVEEVHVQLKELDEIITDQKQINESLGTSIQSMNFYNGVEEEFRKLQLELADDVPEPQMQKPAPQKQAVTEELPEYLSQSLSKLHLEAPQLD